MVVPPEPRGGRLDHLEALGAEVGHGGGDVGHGGSHVWTPSARLARKRQTGESGSSGADQLVVGLAGA